MKLDQTLEEALALVFPNRCVGCKAYIRTDRMCCTDCAHAVFPIEGPMCPRCGHPRPRVEHGYAGVDDLCRRCLERTPRFDRARALWEYSGVVAQAVQRAKYRRQMWVLRRLARPLRPFLSARIPRDEPPLVTVVPMHPDDLRRRGFNAALMLYRLALPDHPPEVDLLAKVRRTPAQAGLSRQERLKNLREAYVCKRPDIVSGREVVVFDDVMTTGATAHEVARALKTAGARRVDVVTAARAVATCNR